MPAFLYSNFDIFPSSGSPAKNIDDRFDAFVCDKCQPKTDKSHIEHHAKNVRESNTSEPTRERGGEKGSLNVSVRAERSLGNVIYSTRYLDKKI